MIWQKGIGMRGKLKKIIAVSGIILVIVSVPFQYIWANQEDTDRRSFVAEQIIEEGTEYGSVVEKKEEIKMKTEQEAEETLEEQTKESEESEKQTEIQAQEKTNEEETSIEKQTSEEKESVEKQTSEEETSTEKQPGEEEK